MHINLSSPINELSYGLTSKAIIKELDKLGHEIALFPIGQVQCAEKDFELIQRCINNSKKFKYYAPSVRIFHQFSLAERFGKGPSIGFPIFELDRFREDELHHLKSVENLIVCSKWAKNIIEANGINIPTNVVPLGVDTSIFTPKPMVAGPTVFVNIGKWELRKGHDVLIRAFDAAFPNKKDVKLFLLANNPFLKPEEKMAWERQYKVLNVSLISRLTDSSEVARILYTADCGVFPSRAEGWNLGALETLACGRHLIITDYSAHTEYCTTENARLISIDETEPASDGKWFHGEGNWAKFDKSQFDQLVHHLRSVHEAKQSGALGVNEAGVKTAQQFTWTNSAERLIGAIGG